MKSRWEYHKGYRIFIADFSHYGSDVQLIRAETQHIISLLKKEPLHSVLSLTTVEDTYANEEILRALAELLPISNQYVKRRAVVGITGFRRHFLDAFVRLVGEVRFSSFDTQQQALDWLVA